MIKGYQKELANIYEKIKDTEKQNLENRRKEIESKYPEIMELDTKIQKTCLNLSLSILKGLDQLELQKIKDEITDLRFKKYELLVSKGYSPEYLNLHYQCSKCKDEGYIGTTQCSCYKNKLVKLYYRNSDLEDAVRISNFKNFNIHLYSNNRINDDKYSPRENIEKILEDITGNYIPNFNVSDTNLLFYGNSGTGKTYLSCCIAKSLLDLGYLVVYKTSDEIIRSLREIRFNNNYELEELLLNCDLLIIDDLGAEQITDFSVTELFNLINKKLLKKKKMLISTNLTLSKLTEIYSERLSSRLIGNFKLCKFYAADIRIQLNLKRR
ncbi:ATP-binding protein [Clostridium sp.]|uniref:ATP-binding protein n=1 Tax=Clostridium sp. TaxID=1506 RepID=UPI003F3F6A25